ncbi:hypothetical protein Tco_1287016 [Tanacetum coccineum]
MIAPGSSRYSSNDMVHNHYLEEAKKKTQESSRNLEPSVMPSTRSQSTANGSKPKLRINNQMSRNWHASKSSCVMTKNGPIAEQSRNSRSFSDSKHFVCSTCQKCIFNANHDSCVTKFLNKVNSRAKTDADHAGCIDTRKSTSGGIQFLGDKLVSWMSKKQDCTAMSSAEAEYVALSASCAQVMWMRTQLKDYGFNYNKIPLYCDSQSAIAISCNPVQHSRTKHIHTRYHFIKEQVENGIIELYFVRTEYQLADMFTKALPEDRFQYLVRRIGMRCLTPAELEVLANESA